MLRSYGFTLEEVWGMTIEQAELYMEAISKDKNGLFQMMAVAARMANADQKDFKKMLNSNKEE